MNNDFENRATSVAQRVASSLDTKLQESAISKNWTTPINVESRNGEINVVYKQQHQSDIFNAEYGAKGQAPNSVIRPFLGDAESLIKQEIELEALDYLFEAGVLP